MELLSCNHAEFSGFQAVCLLQRCSAANDRHSSCSCSSGKDTWRTTLRFYHPFLSCTREAAQLLPCVTVPLLSKPSSETMGVLLSRMFLWFLRGCSRERFPSFSKSGCKTVRKSLTDTKAFCLRMKIQCTTPGRSLRVNLEYVVKITVHLVLGKLLPSNSLLLFMGIRLVATGFWDSPAADGENVATVFAVPLWSIALRFSFRAGTSLVNPSSGASPSATGNGPGRRWHWALATPLGGPKAYIYANGFYETPTGFWDVATCALHGPHLPVPFKHHLQYPSFLGGFGGGCEQFPHCAFCKQRKYVIRPSARQVVSPRAWGCILQ